MRHRAIRLVHALAVVAPLLAVASAPGLAAEPAQLVAEINATAAAATAVVAGLQERINAGRLPAADLEPAPLRAAWRAAYERATRRTPEAAVAGGAEVAEIHAAMERALDQVIAAFRPDILRGGQDAFVPAFFRAQLFERFNEGMQGRYRAVATNRGADLINADSTADRLIEDAEIRGIVQGLLDQGSMRPETRSVGSRTLGYWPMTIGEACAACHQRSGLRQEIGQFGGATVVIAGR